MNGSWKSWHRNEDSERLNRANDIPAESDCVADLKSCTCKLRRPCIAHPGSNSSKSRRSQFVLKHQVARKPVHPYFAHFSLRKPKLLSCCIVQSGPAQKSTMSSSLCKFSSSRSISSIERSRNSLSGEALTPSRLSLSFEVLSAAGESRTVSLLLLFRLSRLLHRVNELESFFGDFIGDARKLAKGES